MHRKRIIDKISNVLEATSDSYEQSLTEMLDKASRIFISGAGRSGLVAKFFAMRLMHAGYNVYIVGEIVTPSIQKGDLFIVITGSGETETMIAFCKRAQKQGASIVTVSTKKDSTIGNMSDLVIQVGNEASYAKVVGMPMGTTFELSTLFFLEAIVSHIIHEKGIAEEVMRGVHANLE